MSQLVAEQSIRLRSRARTHEGLVALQRESIARRDAVDLAVRDVVKALQADESVSFPELVQRVVEQDNHPRRRVVDAIFHLKALGRVRLDVATSTVALRTLER